MDEVEYRGWKIWYCAKPIPIFDHDWEFIHTDYDEGDDRHGTAPSREDAKRQIDEWEVEHG